LEDLGFLLGRGGTGQNALLAGLPILLLFFIFPLERPATLQFLPRKI